jgi:hypothetical protein
MVIVDSSIAADLLTVSVKVLVELVVLGERDAVTPFGKPLTVKATL